MSEYKVYQIEEVMDMEEQSSSGEDDHVYTGWVMREEVVALAAERDQLQETVERLDRQIFAVINDCKKFWDERTLLKDAIIKHRRDMWGDMTVNHLYDVRLYEALQEVEG